MYKKKKKNVWHWGSLIQPLKYHGILSVHFFNHRGFELMANTSNTDRQTQGKPLVEP